MSLDPSRLPHWAYLIFVIGVLGLSVYQVITVSEKVAHHFGALGKRIYDRASVRRRLPKRLERIEVLLMQASDKLECATAYLCLDAEYHNTADVIIAEHCPGVASLLPRRVSYSEFSRRWHEEGWRP